MNLNLTRSIAFIDLETTGINIIKDRIVEIAILKVSPGNEKQTKTLRVNPGMPIPKQAADIHGIFDEDVKDCPTFPEIAGEIASFIENCDLGGYNSNKFDIPLLAEEFSRTDVYFELKNRRFVDVQNIFHKMEQRTLIAAYKFYCGKNLENAHSAEADILATYEVLLAQIEKYDGVEFKNKKGDVSCPVVNDIQSLADFSLHNRNVDMVGHIVYNEKDIEVFNFGKHKGKAVTEVFRAEPQYYHWMMKSDFSSYTKKIITEIQLREFND